ncbi:tRNA uridine(34) 5-carboxymethylaminomethyl modification radical SAM/GNAT enzyme Elp3 [Myxococcota bacterium]|nr:tRNA uridine(34) 5-carboxymethylaminomethyl modification radical SAM/GNAT enzyme Elp3 [Myxococcota bacterium]
MSTPSRYDFIPDPYEQELTAIITELLGAEVIDDALLTRVLKRHPKDGSRTFSKSELVRGFRRFDAKHGWSGRDPRFVEKLRTKPVRTESGVAPVTVLTKPFPCPGVCVFCPSDVRMPKSYLSMEPGAQRAAQHAFDPYHQTFSRLRAFHVNGHKIDKVELIVLGGTWSSYPEEYQRWFVKRCLDAMNDFVVFGGERPAHEPRPKVHGHRDFTTLDAKVDGRTMAERYNTVVARHLREHQGGELLEAHEDATWEELEVAQRANERAGARCVGLSLETRPDHVTTTEVLRLRRLGATKIQLGIQSLTDDVLARTKRGHDVEASRRAIALLRRAGFKIHAHWMPNLVGATPESDVEDFERLFSDPAICPDELKLYPCSLVESAELMQLYTRGEWRPYTEDELVGLLGECLRRVPRWCRLTRVIRDIPSHDIVVGNKLSNLRQLATGAADARGIRSVDVRSREIRQREIDPAGIGVRETSYETSTGRELFLEIVTVDDELVAFVRLALPRAPSFVDELGGSAIIREVHVYGVAAALGERDQKKSQHLGLGRRLVGHALARARGEGYDRVAVISAIGTRAYYRDLGFEDGALYQHHRV